LTPAVSGAKINGEPFPGSRLSPCRRGRHAEFL